MRALFLAVCTCLIFSGAVSQAAPSYQLLQKISVGGDGGWDYLNFDSTANRLYVSRGTHVMVLDGNSGKVLGDIPDTAGVHGIALDLKDGRGFTSNGQANSVTIFDLKTLSKIADVTVDTGPDCIVYDPFSNHVLTFNGRAQSASVIDAAKGTLVATIALPGRPEYAAADGLGHVYDNITDKSEIVEIDSASSKIMNTWPIDPGKGPSGLAVDAKSRRLFAVCDNQKLMVLDADSGKVVSTVPIGNGPDACGFDPASKLVFSPNGEDGTLTVIKEDSPDTFTVAGTITTQSGARTMALDPKTHDVYTVTATVGAPTAGQTTGQQPRWRRQYVPGTFVLLKLGPPPAVR
jgi:DNA-binding beta-propeller fold protein YncE